MADGENMDPRPLVMWKYGALLFLVPHASLWTAGLGPAGRSPVISTQQCMFYNYSYSYQDGYYSACI